MCKDCGYVYGHATMCPNGNPTVDEILVDCALCGDEVDEETTMYGICEQCWTDHHNFDNALSYGARATKSVKINGLIAKLLTPDQINFAITQMARGLKKCNPLYTEREVQSFLRDDDGDFADWLKEQKNID